MKEWFQNCHVYIQKIMSCNVSVLFLSLFHRVGIVWDMTKGCSLHLRFLCVLSCDTWQTALRQVNADWMLWMHLNLNARETQAAQSGQSESICISVTCILSWRLKEERKYCSGRHDRSIRMKQNLTIRDASHFLNVLLKIGPEMNLRICFVHREGI